MTVLPWRESASLILACGRNPMKILLLERSARGTFAKSRVFPGGVLDGADVAPKWVDVFKSHRVNLEEVLIPAGGHRPPCLRPKQDEIPREVSFRIAAIRETFEESGILLCNPRSALIAAGNELSVWRDSISRDGSKFFDMCEKLQCYPDIGSLKLWSDWLTPIDVPGKRFDTVFFVAASETSANEDMPKISINEEMQHFEWVSPVKALMAAATGKAKMAPPQMYEFARLLQFHSSSDLVKFAEERQKHGCVLTFPVSVRCKDGNVRIFPGDDAYPKEPDYFAKDASLATEETMAEFRRGIQRFHRFESDFKDRVKDFHLNILLEPLHCSPKNLTSPTEMAKLGLSSVTSRFKEFFN